MHRVSLDVAAQIALATFVAALRGEEFSFKRQLFGPPSTLFVFVQSLNVANGAVEINGVDTRQSTTPFSWDWGDGMQTKGFFPQRHTYANRSMNYVVSLTAHYSGGGTDTAETVIRFVAPQVTPIPILPELSVSIPPNKISLTSRMPGYVPPPTLTFYSDDHFRVVPRSTIEYVLSVAALEQMDFLNGDVAEVGNGFQQALLRDPALAGGGMYSLWFTDPVAFGAAAEAVSGTIAYSSFMHEMGHNFTLNSPADFYYGGKIDGNANAIFSESMAQIFQHATAYDIINHARAYGLSDDLATEIKLSAIASMRIVRNSFDEYVQAGAVFESWNDPATPEDETFGTFMTIAFKFFDHAETEGWEYRIPFKRMMRLLQIFNQDMVDRYDRLHDTAAAATFRSTLMVAAVSYGFDRDLRDEFETLGFPIDGATFDHLLGAVRVPGDVNYDGHADRFDHYLFVQCFGTSNGAIVGGPSVEISSACADADFNTDRAIDLRDFAIFQSGFLQPGSP